MTVKDPRFAAAVLIYARREGVVVVVVDPSMHDPLYIKLPGGRPKAVEGGNCAETPEQCAIREAWEETGIKIPPEELRFVAQTDRGTHDFYVFAAEVQDLYDLKAYGDEGEIVLYRTPRQLLDGVPVQIADGRYATPHPDHMKFIRNILIEIKKLTMA